MRYLAPLLVVLAFLAGFTAPVAHGGGNPAQGSGVVSAGVFGRQTGLNGVAAICTFAVGANDASVEISPCVMVTSYSSGSFNMQVLYTDEGNVSRTADCIFNAGAASWSIAINSANSFEGGVLRVRAKAGTNINVATTAPGGTLTYNVECEIRQVRSQ